jgi:hypothetical protein
MAGSGAWPGTVAPDMIVPGAGGSPAERTAFAA